MLQINFYHVVLVFVKIVFSKKKYTEAFRQKSQKPKLFREYMLEILNKGKFQRKTD